MVNLFSKYFTWFVCVAINCLKNYDYLIQVGHCLFLIGTVSMYSVPTIESSKSFSLHTTHNGIGSSSFPVQKKKKKAKI